MRGTIGLIMGIIIGTVLYSLDAPWWAIVGFAWMGADHSTIYFYVKSN